LWRKRRRGLLAKLLVKSVERKKKKVGSGTKSGVDVSAEVVPKSQGLVKKKWKRGKRSLKTDSKVKKKRNDSRQTRLQPGTSLKKSSRKTTARKKETGRIHLLVVAQANISHCGGCHWEGPVTNRMSLQREEEGFPK